MGLKLLADTSSQHNRGRSGATIIRVHDRQITKQGLHEVDFGFMVSWIAKSTDAQSLHV